MSSQENVGPQKIVPPSSAELEVNAEPEVEIAVGSTAPIKEDKTEKKVLASIGQDAKTAVDLLDELVKTTDEEWIPWEEFTLPSQGAYYNGQIPGGKVMVRALDVMDDKILATQRLAATGQTIDYMFNHAVKLPDGFDQADLLVGDRIFLLYVIRGITHGNVYEFIIKCPNCGSSSSHTYNLNELSKTIKSPNYAIGEEPFKVVLPYLSQRVGKDTWVRVKLMRGRDASSVLNRQKFNRRAQSVIMQSKAIEIDKTVTENLHLVITAFGSSGLAGEVTDRIKIQQLVEKMHATDTATIRTFLKDNSPGIDTTVSITCPDCSNEYEPELPITESFFRPTRSK